MPTLLRSDLARGFHVHSVASDDGWMYFANGQDSIFRWNGVDSTTVNAGLAPPATKLTITANPSDGGWERIALGSEGFGTEYGVPKREVYMARSRTLDVNFLAINDGFLVFTHTGEILYQSFVPGQREVRGIDYDETTGVLVMSYQYTIPQQASTQYRVISVDPVAGSFGQNVVAHMFAGDQTALENIRGATISPTHVFAIAANNDVYRLGRNSAASSTGTKIFDLGTIPLNDINDIRYAAQDGRLYYSTGTSALIRRLNVDGTGDTLIYTSPGGVTGLHVHDQAGFNSRIYFTRAGGGATAVDRINFNGSIVDNLFLVSGFTGSGLVYDERRDLVFMADSDSGDVWRFNADGSSPTIIFNLGAKYAAYSRFFDSERRFSALSPPSEPVTLENNLSQLVYTNVPQASAPAVGRQILRNTDGQMQAFYVDLETSDLTSTTLNTTNSDADIRVNNFLAVQGTLEQPIITQPLPPPSDKPLILFSRGRMFLAGESVFRKGSVSLTNGSATVTGAETEFHDNLEGRFFRVPSENETYEIDSVASATSLTLTSNYTGSTGLYEYEIRSSPAQRTLLYYSEPFNYDGYDPAIAISIGTTGEAATALFEQDTFVYIALPRELYKLTYSQGPELDGNIFRAVQRGCVSARSFAQIDDTTYLLDEDGIYRFQDGRARAVSGPIQNIFRRRTDDLSPRINWAAKDQFHATRDLQEETIRFFVAFVGESLPKHAIGYRYTMEEWFLEEYPFPITASDVLLTSPKRQVVGATAQRLLTLSGGSLDLVDPGNGETSLAVTGATIQTLEFDDDGVTLPDNLAGAPLVISDGRGAGQRRTIVSVAGGTITLLEPWTTLPNITSRFQLGGIQWTWRGRRFRWADINVTSERRLEMTFTPGAGALLLRRREDQQPNALPWADNHGTDFVRYRRGDTAARIDLSATEGLVQIDLDAPQARRTNHPGLVEFEMSGVSGAKELAIHDITLDGARIAAAGAVRSSGQPTSERES